MKKKIMLFRENGRIADVVRFPPLSRNRSASGRSAGSWLIIEPTDVENTVDRVDQL